MAPPGAQGATTFTNPRKGWTDESDAVIAAVDAQEDLSLAPAELSFRVPMAGRSYGRAAGGLPIYEADAVPLRHGPQCL